MMKNQRTAIVTGTTSEIGSALCKLLLNQNYSLLNIDRNRERALKVKLELLEEFPEANIKNIIADLSILDELDSVVKSVMQTSEKIDVVFHNAGVLLKEKTLNSNGIEMHFSVNCLAPYLLTLKLLPLLKKSDSASVVVSGSGASQMAKVIKVAELTNPQKYKAMSGAYAQSKAAVKILFEYLQRQYHDNNIRFKVVDLPPTKSRMTKSDAMPQILKWFSFLFSSPEKSANRLLDAASTSGLTTTNLTKSEFEDQLIELVRSIDNIPA